MGWDFTKDATKEDIVREASAGAIETKLIGNCLWSIRNGADGKYIRLALIRSQRGFEYGYKSMCESMHPFYYSCPLKFLDAVPAANLEWREGVKRYWARNGAAVSINERR